MIPTIVAELLLIVCAAPRVWTRSPAADARRNGGPRLIVQSDEKLAAFLELERIARDDSD